MEELLSNDSLTKTDISSVCLDAIFLEYYNSSWNKMRNNTVFTTQSQVINHAEKICYTYYFLKRSIVLSPNSNNKSFINCLKYLKKSVNSLERNMLFYINMDEIYENCDLNIRTIVQNFQNDDDSIKKIMNYLKNEIFSEINHDMDEFIELFHFCDYQNYLRSSFN